MRLVPLHIGVSNFDEAQLRELHDDARTRIKPAVNQVWGCIQAVNAVDPQLETAWFQPF
jgi:diketogulonate reductase-like aldo/keto reductase